VRNKEWQYHERYQHGSHAICGPGEPCPITARGTQKNSAAPYMVMIGV
jgi:hypothetical protein